MTIVKIIGADRDLSKILVQSGISSLGNKATMSMALYEAADSIGENIYTLENIMNDYQ